MYPLAVGWRPAWSACSSWSTAQHITRQGLQAGLIRRAEVRWGPSIPLPAKVRAPRTSPPLPAPHRQKKNKKQGPMARSHRGARKLGWAALPPMDASWPTGERPGTAQVPRTARGKSIPAAVRGWRRPTLCSCQSPELTIFAPACSLARSHGLTARINVEIIGHMGQTENG